MQVIQVEEIKVEEIKVEEMKVETNESYSSRAANPVCGLLLGNEQVSPLPILIAITYILSNFFVIGSFPWFVVIYVREYTPK